MLQNEVIKKNKDKKSVKKQTLSNDIYIFKLIYSLCPKRVIQAGIQTFFDYLQWIFYSGIFVRYVIGGIQGGKSFGRLMIFVGITVVFSMAIS
jgi:hypothetical protein